MNILFHCIQLVFQPDSSSELLHTNLCKNQSKNLRVTQDFGKLLDQDKEKEQVLRLLHWDKFLPKNNVL